MEKHLIINADDLGLSKEVNDGIIEAFRNGCVTSASLITTENGFEDAVQKIKENPALDIGIHLNIATGHAKIRLGTLVLQRILKKRALEEKIYREFQSQIKKALDQGIVVSHLDTEKHFHIFPFILKIVIMLAKEHNIGGIRFPFETPFALWKTNPRQLSKVVFSYLFYNKCRKLFEKSGIQHPDFFYGISLSTKFSVDNLKKMVDNIEYGTSELSCHPARHMSPTSSFIGSQSRDEERRTLTSPVLLDYLKEKRIILVNFKILEN